MPANVSLELRVPDYVSMSVPVQRTPEGLLTRAAMDKEMWLLTGFTNRVNFPTVAIQGRHKALAKVKETMGFDKFIDAKTKQVFEGLPMNINESICWERYGSSIQLVRVVGEHDQQYKDLKAIDLADPF